jgi:hypothetical protein
VRADATLMAARTVWARENLNIGKQPFWSAGRYRTPTAAGDSGD